MWRLTERMVRSTLVTAWFLAGCPTRTSPFLAKATMDGVVRDPSALAITVGSPPSRTATTELVVPRSIPTARAMVGHSLRMGNLCLVLLPPVLLRLVVLARLLQREPLQVNSLESPRLNPRRRRTRPRPALCSPAPA